MGIMKALSWFYAPIPTAIHEAKKHSKHKEQRKARSAAAAEEERKLTSEREENELARKQMLQGNQNILGNAPTSTGNAASRGRLLNV